MVVAFHLPGQALGATFLPGRAECVRKEAQSTLFRFVGTVVVRVILINMCRAPPELGLAERSLLVRIEVGRID